jgi:hypothetical protein
MVLLEGRQISVRLIAGLGAARCQWYGSSLREQAATLSRCGFASQKCSCRAGVNKWRNSDWGQELSPNAPSTRSAASTRKRVGDLSAICGRATLISIRPPMTR